MAAVTNFYESNRQIVRNVLMVAGVVLILLWLVPLVADKTLARMLQTTITGLLIGGVYALLALGIVLINKASGVFNFAHGFMMLFGGFMFFSFFSVANPNLIAVVILATLATLIVLTMNGLSALREPRTLAIGVASVVVLTVLMTLPGREWQFVRAPVGALVGAVLTGLTIERFSIRPLIGQPLFTAVLMTLAVGEGVMLGATQLVWGSIDIPLPIFAGLQEAGMPTTIRIQEDFLAGFVILRTDLIVTFVLALLAFAAFVLFFRYTNVGLAMRATAENQQLAQSVGLRVRTILAVAWAIAAILATVTGILQGGATSLSLNMPLLALRAFPAVLLGGLESIGGALVGGLVIGLVQEWANLLFPGTQAGTELAPYVVLMFVLIVRPDGLFGERRIERI